MCHSSSVSPHFFKEKSLYGRVNKDEERAPSQKTKRDNLEKYPYKNQRSEIAEFCQKKNRWITDNAKIPATGKKMHIRVLYRKYIIFPDIFEFCARHGKWDFSVFQERQRKHRYYGNPE